MLVPDLHNTIVNKSELNDETYQSSAPLMIKLSVISNLTLYIGAWQPSSIKQWPNTVFNLSNFDTS